MVPAGIPSAAASPAVPVPDATAVLVMPGRPPALIRGGNRFSLPHWVWFRSEGSVYMVQLDPWLDGSAALRGNRCHRVDPVDQGIDPFATHTNEYVAITGDAAEPFFQAAERVLREHLEAKNVERPVLSTT